MSRELSPRNFFSKTRILHYFKMNLQSDVIAGLTLAMIVIPQSMAYAQIANLHPLYGVFTAILPAIIGSLFGSSNHLHTGPTNATALVVFSVLIAYAQNPNYIDLVFTLSIASGILLLVLGLLKLGSLVRFMSNSVLTGFLAGATILIIIGQLNGLLGLKIPKGLGTLETLSRTLSSLPGVNPYVILIACISIILMVLISRVSNRLPAALITIFVSGLIVFLLEWNSKGVILIKDLGLPENPNLQFYSPRIDINLIPELIPGIIAVSLVNLVETISISKSIALKSGQKINSSREFIGQGLASIAGGFFQCFPPSGSLSRSAINFRVGGKTRMAGMLSGIFVWIVLVLAASFLGYIPMPSLAAIVVVSAIGLFNPQHIKLTWRSRNVSRIVMMVTFLATLFSSPENAIYLGALLSIIIYLAESRHLEITYIEIGNNGEFIEKTEKEINQERPQLVIVDVEGDYFFGAVEELEEKINPILDSGIQTIILRIRRLRLISSTGLTSLSGIIQTAQRKGIRVMVCGVKDAVSRLLENSGISTLLGSDNIYYATDTLHESTLTAIRQAKNLTNNEK